jgi:HemK-related putative methylase
MFEVAPRGFGPEAERMPPLRFAVLRSLLGRLLALGYRISGKRRYDNFRLERVHDAALVVTPSVLNPKLTRTGEFFASCLDSELIGPDFEVLDMGTGSGVCAVFAARHARRVVAVDINAAAVRCARCNAILNQLENRIEVRHGDLFAPVAGEKFDLILFNPPFLRGPPRDDRDRAWRSIDVAERFAAQVSSHLKPGGAALVLLSTFGDADFFLAEFRKQALQVRGFAQRRFINERLTIFSIRPNAVGMK